MNRIRTVLVLVGCLSFAGSVLPAMAAGDDSIVGVTTDSGDITTIGTSHDGGAEPGGSAGASAPATFVVTTVYTGCTALDATPCATEMATYCPDVPPDGPNDQWRVSTTQVFAIADTGRTNPLSSTTGCYNFAAVATADPGPSQADVREFMTTLIPTSGAGTSPPPDASGMAQFLINLPLIVYATGDTSITAGPVPLVGHEVEVSAEAVAFRWSSGDTELAADRPGGPYDGSPCTASACDAYLHLAPFTEPGQYSLTLTTTWQGRYRVDGGAWIAIDDPIEKVSAPTVANLREARGVLVDD